MAQSKQKYLLHLKGYVGGYDFDSDYVDYILAKYPDDEVNVLIDSLGGSLATALSIVAAFRNHGNVHVHFVGMNASAATIASIGAKRISMDSSAMYLVHKCSIEFFQWASANSDKLAEIIKETRQMKSDLEKMDANVAQLYASKCEKNQEDLLALMKKGGWLTAQEALDWGFVDEVTDFEEDDAPVITDSIAADMTASGIPVPSTFIHNEEQRSGLFTRFVESLTRFFSSENKVQENITPNTSTEMENQNTPTQDTQPVAQEQQTDTSTQQPATPPAEEQSSTTSAESEEATAQATAHANALALKDAEIARLKAEIEELKKAPGASTSQVVEDEKAKHGEPTNKAEAFFQTRQRARALYDMLP